MKKNVFLILVFYIFYGCGKEEGNDSFRLLALLNIFSENKKSISPHIRPNVITGEVSSQSSSGKEFQELRKKMKTAGVHVPSDGDTRFSWKDGSSVNSHNPDNDKMEMDAGYNELLDNKNIPEEVKNRIRKDKEHFISSVKRGDTFQRDKGILVRAINDQKNREKLDEMIQSGSIRIGQAEIPLQK